MNRLILLCLVSGALGAAEGPALPAIDNQKILENMTAAGFKLPERIFTPTLIEAYRKNAAPGVLLLESGSSERGKRWLNIPEARWREMISPLAPITMCGGENFARGDCPFCRKPFFASQMTESEFLNTPFQIKTACCGATIFAREADMPPDYTARPNHTELVTHLDGTVVEYRFFVPPAFKNAPLKPFGDRRHWFCPAAEVWHARLYALCRWWDSLNVLGDLEARVFHENDAQAARNLAIVLDRLAEVMPGLPLYSAFLGSEGLARGTDNEHYLTKDAYLGVPRPRRYEKPFWYDISGEAYCYDKLNWGIPAWQDGVMQQAGNFAELFDLIRDRPEVRKYSQEKYGDAVAWEKKVRTGLLEELRLVCSSCPTTRGNTVSNWMTGASRLGIVLQDRYFYDAALTCVESAIWNAYFSDGLNEQGAFNYAAMTRQVLRQRWMHSIWGGIDLRERNPALQAIDKGDVVITTLLDQPSAHGDQHMWFFRGKPFVYGPPPETPDYAAHELGQCYPDYGLACVRAGGAGQRLEAIMDFQSAPGHTHAGRLNYQLYYQGIAVLPDLGYGNGNAMKANEVALLEAVKYPFESQPLPVPGNTWSWYHTYTTRPTTHCTALVDGFQDKCGPATFHRFWGNFRQDHPASGLQFLEADARAVFLYRPERPSLFHRQLLTVNLPGGRPVLLDFFRIRGGHRHELYWHVPAAPAETTLGPAEPLGTTLQAYFRANPTPGDFEQTGLQFLTQPARRPLTQKLWRAEWKIDPNQYAPRTADAQKHYEPWRKYLVPARLRMHAAVFGSTAERSEALSARGPWVSEMEEYFPAIGRVSNVFALKESLDYLVLSRASAKAPLTTTYATVLEATTGDATPAFTTAEALPAALQDGANLGAGFKFTLPAAGAEKSAEVWVAATQDGTRYEAGGLTLAGRCGLVSPSEAQLVLFDGNELSCAGWAVSAQPSWKLKLLTAGGDISGSPAESFLVVESARPLPADKTLVGQMLTVYHQISDYHSVGYTIRGVSAFGPNRWRIDLEDSPPFLKHKMHIRAVDPKDARHFHATEFFLKGQGGGLYEGCRILFPRSGYVGTLREILAESRKPDGTVTGFHSDDVLLKDVPPAGAVQVGDSFVIYSIQPGDEVVIPSFFGCQGKLGATEGTLNVFTTGAATLTLPTGYSTGIVSTGGVQKAAVIINKGDKMTISLDNLSDGRATILLKK